MTNLTAVADVANSVPWWAAGILWACALLIPWIAWQDGRSFSDAMSSRLGGFRGALLVGLLAVGFSFQTSSPLLVTACILGFAGLTLGAWLTVAKRPQSERGAHKRSGPV